MLRGRHTLLATAALLGCSPAPTGDIRWLTQPTRDQHALFFPVASGPHAVECNSCHGVSETFRDFDCLTCHAGAATIPRHSKVGGFAYTSASCYGCHPDGLAKGVAAVDHAPLFPIAPGDAHAIGASAVHLAGTIQCTSCHVSTADRKQVDCTVCHTSSSMQPLHVAVADLPRGRSLLLQVPRHDERDRDAVGSRLDAGQLHRLPQQREVLGVQVGRWVNWRP